MKWYPFGYDFGNAEMKGVTVLNARHSSCSIPAAFAKVDINAMRNLGVKMDESNTHIIQFQGEAMAYAVGELALQQAVDVYHGRGDIQRNASRYSLRGLLAMAALLIPDTEFGLYVVTGLPAETYIKNMALRNTIKAALDGTHIFTTDNGRTFRRVTVEVATVVMEGAGALISYGDKSMSRTAESAVIDIGGRTTDLYVWLVARSLSLTIVKASHWEWNPPRRCLWTLLRAHMIARSLCSRPAKSCMPMPQMDTSTILILPCMGKQSARMN